MTKVRWGSAGILGVFLAGSVALGVVLAHLTIQEPPPPSLAKPTEPSSVPVVPQAYSDPRPVKVRIETPPETEIRSQRGGTVTRVECMAPMAWESGKSNLSIDGEPVLNFHVSTPLWRDLAAGSKGPDVDAFKEELRRLNQPVSDGAELRWADIVSYRGLAEAAGASAEFRTVSPASMIWLPAPAISLSRCEISLGETIDAGHVIARSRSDILVTVGGDLKPGTDIRQLQVGEATVPLSVDLTLENPGDALALTETTVYRAAIEQDTEPAAVVEIEGTARLVEPVRVAPLPPSSITVSSQTAGCVLTVDGTVVPVGIVSSELGRTLVTFEGDSFPELIATSGPRKCP